MIASVPTILKLTSKLAPKKLAVVSAEDQHVLEAVLQAEAIHLIDPVLFGNKKAIEEILISFGKDALNYTIIDCFDDSDSASKAVQWIKEQKADILMKGLLDTKVLLKAVVNKEFGIRKKSILSHVGLISYPQEKRVFFVTDGAMITEPTIEQKIAIVENAVELVTGLGYEHCYVGLVSSVEKVNERIQSSIDAKKVVEHFQAAPLKNATIDGPFAIDNLVSMESAKTKKIHSTVAGRCDVFVFPNIDGGNIFYKTSVFLGRADSAGIVLGASVPIVLTSRADSSESKLYSIALSVLFHSASIK